MIPLGWLGRKTSTQTNTQICFNFYHSVDHSAGDKLMLVFLYFLENGLWQFLQIVFLGDNMHEIPKPIFWEKQEILFQNVIFAKS